VKDTQMEAGLYCNSCKEELPHHVYYINGKIVRVECQECRRTMVFKVDVLKEFYKEVYKCVFTKPNRVSKEYKKDINSDKVSEQALSSNERF
jgi:transposase-like protein